MEKGPKSPQNGSQDSIGAYDQSTSILRKNEKMPPSLFRPGGGIVKGGKKD